MVTKKPKIAVIGASGMLGYALREVFRDALLFDKYPNDAITQYLDIGERKTQDLESKLGVLGYPGVIINAAAFTNVDGVETREGAIESRNANVYGPLHLAQYAKEKGCTLFHISTAYVFNGEKGHYKETDTPDPLSMYGLHKWIGEQMILNTNHNSFVLRTDVLYSPHGEKSFIDKIAKRAKEKKVMEVPCDQRGSPTYTKDLARMTLHLVINRNKVEPGIYHTVNRGGVSRADLARIVIRILGLQCEVNDITTQDWIKKYGGDMRIAQRPRDCSLATIKLERKTRYHQHSWERALTEYLTGEFQIHNK